MIEHVEGHAEGVLGAHEKELDGRQIGRRAIEGAVERGVEHFRLESADWADWAGAK